jgi:nitroreductase
MDIDELIRTRRAVRQFTDDPVSDEDVRAILDAGRRSQSSKNTQPWTFVVVRDRETLRALSEMGRYAGHLAGAAVGIVLVADATTDDFDIGQAASLMQLAAHGHGIGSCIATIYEPDRARALLGIPDDKAVEIALSFGWPTAEERDRPRRAGGRRPLDEIVRWERW